MTRPDATPADRLRAHVGAEYVSDWREVTQADLDGYAAATGDDDWLHNDPARATAEGPFGGTIAQGFLLLGAMSGLVTAATRGLWREAGREPHLINYGVERLRFVAPVRAGTAVRARALLRGVEGRGAGRAKVTWAVTVERRDGRPAVLAEWLTYAQYA